MTLERRTPLRRRSPLSRGVGIRRRNEKRSKTKRARNFGDEAEAVRAMLCLCEPVRLRRTDTACFGPVQAAHVTARGNGGSKGGRFDIVPLCSLHHADAGEANRPGETGETKRDLFERRYRLDLRAEADRIALGHASPLGIRGLALRWERFEQPGNRQLDVYEWDALLGWARRRMERQAAHRKSIRVLARSGIVVRYWDGLPDNDREDLAHAVILDLGEPFTSDPSGPHGLAWSLCEAAGWPEVDRG